MTYIKNEWNTTHTATLIPVFLHTGSSIITYIKNSWKNHILPYRIQWLSVRSHETGIYLVDREEAPNTYLE